MIGLQITAASSVAEFAYAQDKSGKLSVNDLTLTPDTAIRNKVRGLTVSKVRKMEITGPNYMRFENDPIVITDRKMMDALLNSLRNAVHSGANLADMGQANTLFIYLRGRKDPITFDFNPRVPPACFGPTFYEAVKKLAEYEWHPKHPATP